MYTANTFVLVHFSETFWPMFLFINLFFGNTGKFPTKFGQRFQPWPRSVAKGKDVKHDQS